MKDRDKKIKEPFEPGDTPKPPQIIEPNRNQQRENPVEGESRSDEREKKKNEREKPHLLSDEADIEDETTI